MFAICLTANVSANTIPVIAAQTVSRNFYSQNFTVVPASVTLTFTETDLHGNPVYYAFNINANDGFVIVSADDNAHPIIGYSAAGKFVIPTSNNNFSYWMTMRKNEIIAMRAANLSADAAITNEWTAYLNNIQLNNSRASNVVAPLCTTTWDQGNNGGFYNANCPVDPSLPNSGNSTTHCVTGCVATAMAQIMKFWNYPTQGHGSSSYCDCGSPFSNNYGTLSANYGTSTYNWAAMPNNVTSANASVAKIMSDCGISVQMDYGPDGSGSTVYWSPQSYMGVCARTSYVRFFKYDSTTIHGYDKSAYTNTTWTTLLENELNIGRPIQYAGDDVGSGGGHSWVCDGYDASNNFHMNWGWGGNSNGYFPVTNLSTGTSPVFNPINTQQALIGIKPLITTPNDAGVSAVVSPSGAVCGTTFTPIVTIKNYGSSALTSCSIKYKLDGGSIVSQTYTGSLATNATANVTLAAVTTTSGAHTLACFTSMPNNIADGNIVNDSTIIHLTVGSASLPFTEGFETAAFPPAGWSITQTPADSITWFRNTTAAGNGTSTACAYISNYYYNVAGAKDNLISKPISLAGVNTVTMTFKVAYRFFPNYSNFDSLQVFVSTDCGATYGPAVYTKGDTILQTTGWDTLSFVPAAAADWRTETVNLNSYAGSNIVVKFTGTNHYGNNLYLDDINITGSNAVAPVAKFTASDSTICVGDCISFTDQSTNTPTTWAWTFTGASTTSFGAAHPTNICYNTAGTYPVTLTASNGGGTNTKTKTGYIVVSPLPAVPTINQSGNVLTSSAGVTYQWKKNGVIITGATSISYTVTSPGTYTVIVTNANGCKAVSAGTVVTTTGIDNLAEGIPSVIIYPNPFSSEAVIAVQTANGDQLTEVNFILYDLLGKEVRQINNINGQAQLSKNELSEGLYFYKAFYKNKLIGKGKVVIQN